MFEGNDHHRLRPRDVLYVMIGKHAGKGSAVDDRVLAPAVWYRVSVGVALREWGFEDSASGWNDVRGIVIGADFASVLGPPRLSAGIERASFAPFPCGNPIGTATGGPSMGGSLAAGRSAMHRRPRV